jgi:hypothetical protein
VNIDVLNLQITEQFTPLFLLVAVTILLWDIVLAGWIAARREAAPAFAQLTGLCGLLVAPALVVALATGTEAGSRTISGISWLLPAISCLVVLQVLYALVARLVSSVVALPILLYDLAVAAVTVGDYLVAQHGAAPVGLQAAVAARDAVLGMAIGRSALASPFALVAPMIAPAYQARWRLSSVARASFVLTATILTTLLVLEWPRGLGAVRSYEAYVSEPVMARPVGDFAIGMHLFPTLGGAPPARAAAADLTFARSVRPEIVFVTLDADGARASALDSLAQALETLREDNVRIAVALAVSAQPSPQDDLDRFAAIERVLTRVRPDVIFPALGGPLPSLLRSPAPSLGWWQRVEARSAQLVARTRPRTVIGWAAARLDATDSAVYAWAATPSSPVRLLGAVAYPSFSGIPAIDARLRALERWHARAADAAGADQVHWLVNVGGLPHAHGDLAQVAAIRHTVAWGSRRSWINAAIVGEPADYDGSLGLRAANGRERLAMQSVRDVAKALRDAR